MIIYLIYLYLLIGLICIFKNINIPRIYLGILLFFTFKWIFNYRNCTISRLECILRGVNKHEGYLNYYLDKIVDIRYDKQIKIIL